MEMTGITAHCIGDIHIADRHIAMTDEALGNTLKLVRKRPNVDFICVMGDVFDTHRNLRMDLRNKAIDFIKALSEVRTTIVLVGNHDRVSNRDHMSDVHPFYGMDDIPGKLYIVNRPKMLRFHRKHSILFMPYVYPGRFQEAIDMYLDAMHSKGKLKDVSTVKDIAMIFGHQEFKGVRYGPIESINGDAWPDTHPMVVSGHIHDRQLLKDNIFYTGSLYPITTSEGNDKGVVTCTYDPDSRQFSHKVVRVVTTQKVVLRLDASDKDAITEMVSLDRENTKYIIKGTADEIGAVKGRMKGKKINWVPDVRSKGTGITSTTFDDILREKVTGTEMEGLLSWVLE